MTKDAEPFASLPSFMDEIVAERRTLDLPSPTPSELTVPEIVLPVPIEEAPVEEAVPKDPTDQEGLKSWLIMDPLYLSTVTEMISRREILRWRLSRPNLSQS